MHPEDYVIKFAIRTTLVPNLATEISCNFWKGTPSTISVYKLYEGTGCI